MMAAVSWSDTITYVIGATGVAFWVWMAFGSNDEDDDA
jgi:hypothetical protein